MDLSEHATMVNIILLNGLVTILAVLVHHECLIRLSGWLGRIPHGYSGQFRLIIAVFGILIAHTLEVWLFASAYYFMHHTEGWGELAKNYNGEFIETIYFSYTTFTTLGYGDIEPLGAVRYLTGIEALVGLVLITWSASFLFVEMQRYWPSR